MWSLFLKGLVAVLTYRLRKAFQDFQSLGAKTDLEPEQIKDQCCEAIISHQQLPEKVDTMTASNSPTAKLLEIAIAQSVKSQKDISREAGYSNPNVLTMLKTGQTKVPLARIPKLAIACDLDPLLLLETAMKEYQPETWKVIKETVGTPLPPLERLLLATFREAVATQQKYSEEAAAKELDSGDILEPYLPKKAT